MIGIVALFILSWIALQIFGKQSLSVLGLLPTKTNKTIYFRIPLYRYVMRVGTKYRFLDYTSILETQSNLFIYEFSHSFWWNIKSVLFEEFIFRGALLYIIMQKLEKKGAAFSAICFGIYHWFSYGLFGNFIPMILIF